MKEKYERRFAAVLTLVAVVFAGPAAAAGEGEEEIRQWIRELGSPEFDARERAEERLKETGSAALPLLQEAQKSPDFEIADRARGLVQWIRKWGPFRPFLKRFPKEGQEMAAFAPRAASLFLDENPKRRRASCDLWWKSHEQRVAVLELKEFTGFLPGLYVDRVCHDESADVRRRAVDYLILMQMHRETLVNGYKETLLDRFLNWPHEKGEDWADLFLLLVRMSAREVEPVVLRELESPDGRFPLLAWGAGRLKLEKAIPLLTERLKEDPASETAIWALMEIGKPEAIPALESLLENETPVEPGILEILKSRDDPDRGVVAVLERPFAGRHSRICDRGLEAILRLLGENPSEYPGGGKREPISLLVPHFAAIPEAPRFAVIPGALPGARNVPVRQAQEKADRWRQDRILKEHGKAPMFAKRPGDTTKMLRLTPNASPHPMTPFRMQFTDPEQFRQALERFREKSGTEKN